MRTTEPLRRQDGITLLGLLILVAVLGVVAAAAANVGAIVQRRQDEEELLWVGSAYRDALVRYYNAPSAAASRYPRTLSDLLRDPRQPTPQRYLRRLYADPISGKNDWVLVMAPDGGIACLHSSSTAKPIKVGRFPSAFASFQEAKTYADWLFCVNVGTPIVNLDIGTHRILDLMDLVLRESVLDGLLEQKCPAADQDDALETVGRLDPLHHRRHRLLRDGPGNRYQRRYGVPMSALISLAIACSTSNMPRLIEWLFFCTKHMPFATSQSKVLATLESQRGLCVQLDAISLITTVTPELRASRA